MNDMPESSPKRATILLLDDDPEITSALARGLALHGYDTIAVNRVDHALERLRTAEVSAAIVDSMLGEESGITFVRAARGEGYARPLLMLSALAEVEDRARGLEAGADDYIVKPFSFEELVARLRVQERRARGKGRPKVKLDKATRRILAGDREVTLTEREFALLDVLIGRSGTVLSRGELFDMLWMGEGASAENVVDVYMGYLRRKLAPMTDFGFEIRTIRNRGFVLAFSREKDIS
ncbi:MAG: response regulator transcription factor [Rhodospirillum sp.]|nr:response regulator transcription factor [Rhodospirillum sp.]MCF8490167.1 response regulator transcription factor [Rhodospirillum sp.]MCF8501896.1 response regulator transcription factor [Rhodospirillum sp.]